MRKLFLGIISILLITHAMAVVTECEGIDDYVKKYTGEWPRIVADNELTLRGLLFKQLKNTDANAMIKNWSEKNMIGSKNLKKLGDTKAGRDILKKAGINRLYDHDSFIELRDKIFKNEAIPVTTLPTLATYMGAGRDTLYSWVNYPDSNILYQNQLRLNFVADKLDSLEMGQAIETSLDIMQQDFPDGYLNQPTKLLSLDEIKSEIAEEALIEEEKARALTR